jgi:hypothetical protein
MNTFFLSRAAEVAGTIEDEPSKRVRAVGAIAELGTVEASIASPAISHRASAIWRRPLNPFVWHISEACVLRVAVCNSLSSQVDTGVIPSTSVQLAFTYHAS